MCTVQPVYQLENDNYGSYQADLRYSVVELVPDWILLFDFFEGRRQRTMQHQWHREHTRNFLGQYVECCCG